MERMRILPVIPSNSMASAAGTRDYHNQSAWTGASDAAARLKPLAKGSPRPHAGPPNPFFGPSLPRGSSHQFRPRTLPPRP